MSWKVVKSLSTFWGKNLVKRLRNDLSFHRLAYKTYGNIKSSRLSCPAGGHRVRKPSGVAPSLQPQGRGIMRQMPHGSFALNASLCTPLTLSNRLLITNEDVLEAPAGLLGPFYFAPYHKYLIKLAFFLKGEIHIYSSSPDVNFIDTSQHCL